MKSRLTYLLTLALLPLLLACSPQRRLAHLLAHHPELRGDTIVAIDTAIVRPEKTIERTITLEELSALAHDTAETRDSVENGTEKNRISIAANGMEAAIVANADKSFTLQLKQRADTVVVKKEVKIPTYYTKTQYVDKVVREMTKWQKGMYTIGIGVFTAFALTVVSLIIWLIIKIFVR